MKLVYDEIRVLLTGKISRQLRHNVQDIYHDTTKEMVSNVYEPLLYIDLEIIDETNN